MPEPQPNAPPAQTAAQQALDALRLEIGKIIRQMDPAQAANAIIAFMAQPPPAGTTYAFPDDLAKLIGTAGERDKLRAIFTTELAKGNDEVLSVLEAAQLSGETSHIAVRLLAYLKASQPGGSQGAGGALMIAGALLLAFFLLRKS